MSSNLPPSGPPDGWQPPAGPPSGPPADPTQAAWGGPPAGPPAGPPQPAWGQQPPEVLDSGYGGPIAPPPAPPGAGGGRGRKGLILGGGAVVGLAAVAGGAFAVYQIAFATSPQPAEALPASTVGYVSIDMDPSGKQLVDGLETLKTFPAFADNVDVDSDGDITQRLFDLAQDQGACPEIDYADDIEPWLGQQFAFAGVDVGEELAPATQGIAPVGVLAVKDADAAEAGLDKLVACGGEGASDVVGWSVAGDWVVIAQSDEVAKKVTDDAADNPLSGDDDYQKWTDEVGDSGIVNAYAAPAAGELIAGLVESNPFMGGYSDCSYGSSSGSSEDPFSDDYSFDDYCDDSSSADDEAMAAITESLKGFSGAAVTLRFADGGFEIESASSVDYLGLDKIYSSEGGDDVVAGLPDDTAIAVGLGFEQGWFTEVTDYVESMGVDTGEIDDALAMFEQMSGLSLPEDAETLVGESAAVAIGGDVDFSADEGTGQPVGVKVKGDGDAISSLLDKILAIPELADDMDGEITYQTDGDEVAAGFSDDYNQALLDGGDLGDTDLYQDVVKESDKSAAVVFVNFNAGDWFRRAMESDGADSELVENFDKLEALGMSAWTEDDVSHSVFRITAD